MGSGGGGGALGKETAASTHVLAALAKSRGQSEPSVHWPWPQALPRLAQRFALLTCSGRQQERRSAARKKRPGLMNLHPQEEDSRAQHILGCRKPWAPLTQGGGCSVEQSPTHSVGQRVWPASPQSLPDTLYLQNLHGNPRAASDWLSEVTWPLRPGRGMWLVGVGEMADLKDELKDQSFGRAGRGSEEVKGHTLHTRTPGRLAQGSQGTPTSSTCSMLAALGCSSWSTLRKSSLFGWLYVKDKVQETVSTMLQ